MCLSYIENLKSRFWHKWYHMYCFQYLRNIYLYHPIFCGIKYFIPDNCKLLPPCFYHSLEGWSSWESMLTPFASESLNAPFIKIHPSLFDKSKSCAVKQVPKISVCSLWNISPKKDDRRVDKKTRRGQNARGFIYTPPFSPLGTQNGLYQSPLFHFIPITTLWDRLGWQHVLAKVTQ